MSATRNFSAKPVSPVKSSTSPVPVRVAMTLQLTAFKKLLERVSPMLTDGTAFASQLTYTVACLGKWLFTHAQTAKGVSSDSVPPSSGLHQEAPSGRISMNGPKFQCLCIYIDVLEAPIRLAPATLVQVVQYHLGNNLDAGYGETFV